MHKVIDTPWNTEAHVHTLKAKGVETVIRYFNHSNSKKLPEKRVEKDEADAIAGAGMNLMVVFQQRGGAKGHISDLDQESGERDAKRALELAERIGQPEGSAIYFAVDHDYWRASELAKIKPYFAAVADALSGKYKVGVYGSGKVGKTMRDAGHVDYIWLAAAKGWAGTKDMLKTDAWALYQIWPPINQPLPHDGNVISAAWPEYGQFVPGGSAVADVPAEDRIPAPSTVLMEVIARSGLNLRRGPSENFAIDDTLPEGAIVHALSEDGEWVKVDVQGDGLADGYMHGGYLRPVSGGFPVAPDADVIAANPGSAQSLAFAHAQAELKLGVVEVPGDGNNSRIVLYHQSTNAWSGTDDRVAWCSSFVNYCVEQAGMVGTNSQRALDWETWGKDASAAPREGDIVVWERVGKGGHVGFYIDEDASHISVLGGNQSQMVRISRYPKNGVLGDTTYKLRSIRRM